MKKRQSVGLEGPLRHLIPLAMVVVVACHVFPCQAIAAEQDHVEPLGAVLIAAAPAVLTGLLSWALSRWQSKRDIQKIQEQLDAQYYAARKNRAAQVWEAVVLHAARLRANLVPVNAKLNSPHGEAQEMRGWFETIKNEAGKGAAKDAVLFSSCTQL